MSQKKTHVRQSARSVVMIRPASFCSNPQTVWTNYFQGFSNRPQSESVHSSALREFESVAAGLAEAGVRVHVFDDCPTPPTPDSIFPNNWFSTHSDGTVVLYPLMAPNRRLERRQDILQSVKTELGFEIREIIDLTHHERANRFLEGTGSLVLDRVHRIAYACFSPRTDSALLIEFGRRMTYDAVGFATRGLDGHPVYHTNVLLCVGEFFAAICAEAIPDAQQRRTTLSRLESTGHEVVHLTLDQLASFAGNMLELESENGDKILAISRRGEKSLTRRQIRTLEQFASILSFEVQTIEDYGGGSVRCMLAEVFLPSQKARPSR